MVALEAAAGDAELGGEGVQLLEGAVDGHVAPVLDRPRDVRVVLEGVDEDRHCGYETRMTNEGHSVAIVEDHGPLRIFLRDVLQQRGWTVTGVAGTAEGGEELILETTPDVAVVDLHLASEGGGEGLIRRLAESDAGTKVVVFTATTDPTELQGVLDAGADGIVLKEGGLPELIDGLDAVTRGERYVSPSVGGRSG